VEVARISKVPGAQQVAGRGRDSCAQYQLRTTGAVIFGALVILPINAAAIT
jgi:hypothetical protein